MTDAERQAVKTIPRPLRANAIGMALVSMVMAIMINFVDNPVAVFMPLLFGFVGLGYAIQARKSSGSVAQAVAKGTVTEVRVTPRWMGARGWQVGTFSIPRSKHVEGLLVDGVPATVGIVPEAKRVVSVGMTTLRKPVTLIAPSGFESTLVSAAPVQAPPVQDVPPPPEGWAQMSCPQCGQGVSGDVLFCEKCGYRLRP
jgi:hypothetical protein